MKAIIIAVTTAMITFAVSLHAADTKENYSAAVKLIKVGQYGPAVSLLEDRIQAEPNDVNARAALAYVHVQRKNEAAALQEYKAIVIRGDYTQESSSAGKAMQEILKISPADFRILQAAASLRTMSATMQDSQKTRMMQAVSALEQVALGGSVSTGTRSGVSNTEQGIEFPRGWSFVLIKPGTFTMGSPTGEPGREEDETTHQVTLTKAFWMGSHEVTQQQYEEIMARNPSHFRGANRPVENVSWNDAQDFIRKLNERERKASRLTGSWFYRLPTEAEWEYACRAGTQTAYCFGNGSGALEDYAWYSENSGKETHDVGQKRANAWGLYDMHGNVWEWCQDWYGAYPTGAVTDPQGAPSGSDRVLRGGGWIINAGGCRSAFRYWNYPVSRSYYYGFRVAALPQAQ